MAQSTRANGSSKKARKTAEAFRFGLMALDMMDSGEMEWLMGMEDLSMQKVTFMKVNGPRIKQMDLESIPTITEADMKVNGFKINNMAMVLNNGLMELSMKDNTNRA